MALFDTHYLMPNYLPARVEGGVVFSDSIYRDPNVPVLFKYLSSLVRFFVGPALILISASPGNIFFGSGMTEFTSMAILKWVQDMGIDWHYIAPGKPQKNGFIEIFNGKLRPSQRWVT